MITEEKKRAILESLELHDVFKRLKDNCDEDIADALRALLQPSPVDAEVREAVDHLEDWMIGEYKFSVEKDIDILIRAASAVQEVEADNAYFEDMLSQFGVPRDEVSQFLNLVRLEYPNGLRIVKESKDV